MERDWLKGVQRVGDRRFPDGETDIHRIQARCPFFHAVQGQGQYAQLLKPFQGPETCPKLRASVRVPPLESLRNAHRQSGAADARGRIKDLLDPVDPLRREPFPEKGVGLEGLGIKGHRIVSRKQGETYGKAQIESSTEEGKTEKGRKPRPVSQLEPKTSGENYPSTKVNAIGGVRDTYTHDLVAVSGLLELALDAARNNLSEADQRLVNTILVNAELETGGVAPGQLRQSPRPEVESAA